MEVDVMFGLGIPELLIILTALGVAILPFIINAYLAKSRGKSVVLMLLLTIIFSWIVTLVLAFFPKIEKADTNNGRWTQEVGPPEGRFKL